MLATKRIKSELDKQGEDFKEVCPREQKKMQELESVARKAKFLHIQRQDEGEEAKSSTVCAEEDHLISSGDTMRDASELEKRRTPEEEALQKSWKR